MNVESETSWETLAESQQIRCPGPNMVMRRREGADDGVET